MSLSFSDVITPATQQQWLASLLQTAGTLGLPTTAWQSGGVARTIITLMSYACSRQDGIISLAAQGGFLDFAGTGTVTYTDTSGRTVTVPVTPDPSVPSQLSAWLAGPGGWLDIVADGVYNVQRIGAGQAGGPMAFANTTGTVYGPYAAGTYHVSNLTTSATYTNSSALTIAAASYVGGGLSVSTPPANTTPCLVTTTSAHGLTSGQYVQIPGGGQNGNLGIWQVAVVSSTQFTLNGSVGNAGVGPTGTVNVCSSATFAADSAGTAGTSAPNTVQQLTTSLVGVTGTNPGLFTGTGYEGNVALVRRCRLKLQALSPNGPGGAYLYFALSASQYLAAQSLSDGSGTALTLSGGPITRAINTVNQATGQVTTTVANASGPVSGVANLAIIGATNAAPIVVQTASAHGLSTGAEVYVSGVVGNSGANGYWSVVVSDATHFSLSGSVGTGAYVSGGTVEGGDLGLVDSVIQANCVPNAVSATTVSAPAQPVTVTGTVFVPAAQVAAYTVALSSALTTFFASLPIGGLSTDNAQNVLSLEVLEGVVYQAGVVAGASASYVRGILDLGLQIASPSGPLVTGASNASPIVITTGAVHGLSTGSVVVVAGVAGNTAANGRWVITKLGAFTFSLNGSTGNGAYTANTATVTLIEGDLAVGATSVVTLGSNAVVVVGQ